MAALLSENMFGHWAHLVDGLKIKPSSLYNKVASQVADRGLPKAKLRSLSLKIGGAFSGKREYLQIKRGEHVFLLCAAPFGEGFFVSWRHFSTIGVWRAFFSQIPIVGRLLFRTFTPFRG